MNRIDADIASAEEDRHAANRLTAAVQQAIARGYVEQIESRLPDILIAGSRLALAAEERMAKAAERHQADLAKLDSPQIRQQLTQLALQEARRRPTQVLQSIAAERPDAILKMADEIRRRQSCSVL